MAVSLLLLAVDYQTLRVDPDARNKKDDVGFLNQSMRLYTRPHTGHSAPSPAETDT